MNSSPCVNCIGCRQYHLPHGSINGAAAGLARADVIVHVGPYVRHKRGGGGLTQLLNGRSGSSHSLNEVVYSRKKTEECYDLSPSYSGSQPILFMILLKGRGCDRQW